MTAVPGWQPVRPGTAIGGRHPWPVWPRVKLAKHAKLVMSVPDRPPEALGRDLLSELFALGLLIRADEEQPPAGDVIVEFELQGKGRFLIGEVDLGTRAGLRAVARGVRHALDAVVRERAQQQEGEARRSTPGPDVELDDPDVTVMTVTEAQATFDDVAARVSDGARVVLTDDAGERLAALLPWSWYARQEQRAALALAAYWKAWRSGRFDPAGYGADLWAAGVRATGEPAPDSSGSTALAEEAGDGDDPD